MRHSFTYLSILVLFSIQASGASDDRDPGCEENGGWEVRCSGGCSCFYEDEVDEDCTITCHERNAECVAVVPCDKACSEACAKTRTRCLKRCVDKVLNCERTERTCETKDDD